MSKRKGSTVRVHKQRRIDALAARQADEDHIPNQLHDGLNWVKQKPKEIRTNGDFQRTNT